MAHTYITLTTDDDDQDLVYLEKYENRAFVVLEIVVRNCRVAILFRPEKVGDILKTT